MILGFSCGVSTSENSISSTPDHNRLYEDIQTRTQSSASHAKHSETGIAADVY